MKVKCNKVYLFNRYGSVDELECDEFFVHKVKSGFKVSLFVKNFKKWQNFRVNSYVVCNLTNKGIEYSLIERTEF